MMSEERLTTEDSEEEEAHRGRMLCPACGHDRLRRAERHGFLQLTLAPFFGLYPWECANCRAHFLFKKRHQQHRNRSSRTPQS